MTTTKIPPRLEARQQPWQSQPAKDQASGSRSSLNEAAEKPYCEPNVVQQETIFNEKRDSDTRLTFYIPSFTELR